MIRLATFLRGKDQALFELFARAGENIQRAAELLDQMLRTFPDSNALAAEIRVCEQEGDQITHELINRMNKTFVTPIEREDVLQLASALDDVVDYIEEVADFLGLYGIEAPMDQALELANIIVLATRELAIALPMLQGSRTSISKPSRSTDSRTRATTSCGGRSPRCSRRGSIRSS